MAISRLIQLDEKSKAERGLVHTPKEILQQPDVWKSAAECVFGQVGLIREFLAGTEIILTGAGSSYFAGVCAEAALNRALGCPVRAVASTEIVMDPESTLPTRPFTLVSLARSGNSPEGNAAFELAEELRGDLVRHIVITTNADGILAGLARSTKRPAALCTLPPETNDQGLAMTSSLTSLVVAAQALGCLDRPGEFLRHVDQLAGAARELLDRDADAIAALAEEKFRRIFFVGARPFFGAALESHLKVQELTDGDVVGKAEDTLGLRHGPMAAIDPETLVVVFGSSDAYRRKYESDLLRELAQKNLGLKRIAVAPRVDDAWRAWLHGWVEFDPTGARAIPDELASVVMILPAQLLGVFKSLDLGLRPDAPSREKVINRVVQGVTIYKRG